MSAPLYPCPNGHLSTDLEYCSECGKKLLAASAANAPGAGTLSGGAASPGGEVCPDCGTARAIPSAAFCEVCRYNFVTKQSWTPDAPLATAAPPAASVQAVPSVVAPPAPVNTAPVNTAPVNTAPVNTAPVNTAPVNTAPVNTAPVNTAPTDMPRRWEAVVMVDPTLYADPDPANPVPVGMPERVFPLDFPENLIGRRSERRAIYPELDLSGDSGVSSRHAILYREADGTLALLDVGSTNGTQVNGSDVAPGVRVPLTEGDQITVGCWTRITLRAAGGKP